MSIARPKPVELFSIAWNRKKIKKYRNDNKKYYNTADIEAKT